MSTHDHVVIAIFDSQDKAAMVVDSLKTWAKVSDGVGLDVGLITKEDGKIKTKIDKKAKSGAKTGLVLGLITAVLSGGVTLIGGVVGGGLLGGVFGSFFKKSVNLTKAEIEEIGKELDEGRTAIVVACNEVDVEPISAHMTMSDGRIRNYAIPTEAFDGVAEAVSKPQKNS